MIENETHRAQILAAFITDSPDAKKELVKLINQYNIKTVTGATYADSFFAVSIKYENGAKQRFKASEAEAEKIKQQFKTIYI